MSDAERARFDALAERWAEYNREPLGRIRRQITWHNLAPHLPAIADAGHPPRVLDVGGGSGELALQLLDCGYAVWLLDPAPAMLEQARRAAQGLSAAAASRLTLCALPAEDAPRSFAAEYFDAITCHTVIEYLPDPRSTLRALVALLREGGLLSLSFVNRHGEVLRRAWTKADPTAALAARECGRFRSVLFDAPGVARTAEEVSAWLAESGLRVAGVYGVRAFADHVPREKLEDPDFFAALLRLELAAAGLPSYNGIARYVQLIAHK